MPFDSDLVLAELRVQTVLLREIHSTLRRQVAAAPLADRLVQAVHGLLADEAFNAPQLVALADSKLSTRLELHAVVDDVVRGLHQAGAARRLGKFLASNTQHEVEGLRLVSVGRERGGLVYRIERTTQTRAWDPWPRN